MNLDAQTLDNNRKKGETKYTAIYDRLRHTGNILDPSEKPAFPRDFCCMVQNGMGSFVDDLRDINSLITNSPMVDQADDYSRTGTDAS